MSYTKQTFTDGTVLTAAHLNHMEDGIANAEQTGGTASLTIGTVTSGSTASASITDGRLNLVLPRGETGPQGEKGDAGTAGGTVLTPEQYGAVGDGETNDAPAIVAAAKAACEQKVRLILTRGRTYLWSDIEDNWSAGLDGLYIEGNGAKIVSRDHRFRIYQMTNTVIHNVDFVGDPSSTAKELIQIFECTGIQLLDCTLEWDLHDNIDEEHNILDVYRGNRDILIRGCTLKQLTGTKAGGIWIREGKAGFVGQNIRMEDCDIYKAGGDEVLAIWGWAGRLKDVIISNCNFVEVDDPKYAARNRDPAWFLGLSADKEGDVVRFENCTVRTCRAGSVFKLGGNGTVTVDNCDILNDSSKASHGYPLLHWNRGDGTDHCVIQNSRITLKGREANRIAYRLTRCCNSQFILDCEGKGFQSSDEIVGCTFTGKLGGYIAQGVQNFSQNRVNVTSTNPNWQSDCLNILNNDISLTIPKAAQGCNIISNQPDGSTFAGNKIKFIVEDCDIRTYGYYSGTHYVYNNQVFTNASLRLESALGDIVHRRNNYINGLPEKSFACTGISFDPAELTESYMKRKEFNAAVTPTNTTDPIVYTITDPDECLQIPRYGAYKPVKNGKVSVTATCGSYDAKQSITVDLVPVACESLRLGRTTASCAKDGTMALRAVYSPYWTTDTIAWASSEPDIATVDDNGVVTGKALGQTIITVTCGSLSASCTVSIVEASELPTYTDGEWLLDGKAFCIPLESIGPEHTLYVAVEVDSSSLEDSSSSPLFGTQMDGSANLLTMRYMKDSKGYGTLSWTTSDCGSDFDTGTEQNICSTKSVAFYGATRLIFAPDGVYNMNGARIWECGIGKGTLSAYGGRLYFNAAGTDGSPTALTGYKITEFILYANETILTQQEILKYRDSADIDIRFTEDGQPVNAGTAGAITQLGEEEPEPTNTNPFPDVQAAYLLPNPKTFDPAKNEYIDTGLKLFESIDPKPSWTILFEVQYGDSIQADMADTFCLMHCMEEADPWPGMCISVWGTSQLATNIYRSSATFGSADAMSKLKEASKKLAIRIDGDTWCRWDVYGNVGNNARSIDSYTGTVDKSLILGAYQASDGTKGRFFDGTLSQCIVYNSALTDDQITGWVKG